MKYNRSLTIAVLVLLASCSSMQPNNFVVSCVITKSGIVSEKTYSETVPDTRTTTGMIQKHVGIRILKETLRIPLQKNIAFGTEYRFDNLPDGETVLQILSHPNMLKPDGSVSTGSRREKEPGIGSSYILNNDYELVPGDWRFEYWHKGKKLCEQTFELYRT